MVDGRLPQCVARRTAEWLLGRELRTEEDPWLDDLTVGFTTSEFRYSELVREIVTSERYRRVQ